MQQVDFYRRLVDEDESLRLVTDVATLNEVVASHSTAGARPLLGLLLLMEGADHIRTPEETELWREAGVRVIGPAWDDTRYCDGAWRGSKRGLSADGLSLIHI